MRDIYIPGDPSRPSETSQDVSLHILLVAEDGVLVVTVWDRGELVGKKSVSRGEQPRVVARRVGLTIGELGRWLSAKRERAARQLEYETQREAILEAKREIMRRQQALRMHSGIGGLFLPQGAFLIGPSLGLEFNGHYPLRLSTEVSWMAGELPLLRDATLGSTAPGWSQWEFALGADWIFPRERDLEISVGGLLAASAVHVSGSTEVDDVSGQRDTWSARAGLRVGTGKQLSKGVRASLDLSAGALLRPIPMTQLGETERLGGPFVGLSLSLGLTPTLSSAP